MSLHHIWIYLMLLGALSLPSAWSKVGDEPMGYDNGSMQIMIVLFVYHIKSSQTNLIHTKFKNTSGRICIECIDWVSYI